jgi:hypothetical protein
MSVRFNPSSIDDILGNAVSPQQDDPIPPPLSTEEEPSVNIDKVYSRLNDLVESGNRILEASQYLVESTPEADNIASASQLLTSMKDVLKEFRLIHEGQVKRDHEKELELMKQQGRKELIELKTEKLLELKNDNSNIPNQIENAVPYSQEETIEKYLAQKNKEPKLIEADIIED